MAKLVWLRNTQPCKLELRSLIDYANQPLIFTPPGTPFARRCVDEGTYASDPVQQYIARGMLINEAGASSVPAAAPAVKKSVAAPKPEPKPEPTPEPEPEPTPEPEPEPEPTPESESEPKKALRFGKRKKGRG